MYECMTFAYTYIYIYVHQFTWLIQWYHIITYFKPLQILQIPVVHSVTLEWEDSATKVGPPFQAVEASITGVPNRYPKQHVYIDSTCSLDHMSPYIYIYINIYQYANILCQILLDKVHDSISSMGRIFGWLQSKTHQQLAESGTSLYTPEVPVGTKVW